MPKAEQLPLPIIPPAGDPVSIVMILKDTHTDNPRVLISQRLQSGAFGYPGGTNLKSEIRYPAMGAARETLEETGIPIDPCTDLREFPNSPVRIAAEGKEREMHIYYYVADGRGLRPERREPGKHSPWRFYPVRLLSHLVAQGMLHPFSCQVDLLGVAAEAASGKRHERYRAWIARDLEITEKMLGGRYEFLDFIHDKEDGHLVF